MYTSTYQKEKNERVALITKWATLVVLFGMIGIYSGLLKALSVSLRPTFIMFLGGVWVSSLFYLMLKD